MAWGLLGPKLTSLLYNRVSGVKAKVTLNFAWFYNQSMMFYQIVELIKSCLCSSVTGVSKNILNFDDFHREIKEHQKNI